MSGSVKNTINRSRIASAAQLQDPRLREQFSLPPIEDAGSAGNVFINAGSVVLDDEAEITVQHDGIGEAGSLSIDAESLLVDNRSSISGSIGSGSGGNINLTIKDLIRIDNQSQITTSAFGDASGGRIEINAGILVGLNGSQISANSEQFFGGEIFITSFSNFFSNDFSITATSALGPEFDGSIQLDIEESVGFNSDDLSLEIKPLKISSQCSRDKASKFVDVREGGLPRNPGDVSENNLSWKPSNKSTTDTHVLTREKSPFIEASGFGVNAEGKKMLVAESETVNLNPIVSIPKCYESARK